MLIAGLLKNFSFHFQIPNVPDFQTNERFSEMARKQILPETWNHSFICWSLRLQWIISISAVKCFVLMCMAGLGSDLALSYLTSVFLFSWVKAWHFERIKHRRHESTEHIWSSADSFFWSSSGISEYVFFCFLLF